MTKKQTSFYVPMARYSAERASMSITVSRCMELCRMPVECAGEGKIRTITSDGYEGERRRMAAKMRSEAGKEMYKKRKETVEWPFGNIKQNLKFRELLTRGIEKVRIEHNLVCTAHNLKVIWGKLERNVPIISMIRTLVAYSASKVGNFLRVHATINFKCPC